MQVKVEKNDLVKVKADLLVVNLFAGVRKPGGATGAVDRALGGYLAKEIAETGFSGKEGETLLLPTQGKIPAKRVLVIGLGEPKNFSQERVRRVAALAVKKAAQLKQRRVATILHGAGIGGLSAKDAARAIVEGSQLALYQYDKYKEKQKQERKQKQQQKQELVIVESDNLKFRAV
ncbi:hypothetical protein EPN90_03325, partial [Patescibacteria group bacterium]